MNSSTFGRRRAAIRVKQRKREDAQQWSPSGKLLQKGRTRRSRHASNKKSWNNRFIYDDETILEHDSSCVPTKRLGSAKTNNKPSKSSSEITGPGPKIKHYAERADGEVLKEFSRCEISTTLPIVPNNEQYSADILGQRSVSTSPFDMDKVKASLEAHVLANGDSSEEEDETNQTSPQHESYQRTDILPTRVNEQLANHLLLFNSPVLDNMEDFLYSIELENESLRRDLAMRNQKTRKDARVDHSQPEQNRRESRITIPPDRCEQIMNRNPTKEQKYPTKTGGNPQETVASLADSIVENCIKDIAAELFRMDWKCVK